MSLLRGDDPAVGNGSEHLRLPMHRLDDRRTDEDRAHGLALDLQVGREGADLAAEGVAAALDVEHFLEMRVLAERPSGFDPGRSAWR